MGKLILITGGAKSGKSSEAERQIVAAQLNPVAYVATQSRAFMDSEMEYKIRKHQESRPENWITFEEYIKVAALLESLEGYQAVLIDCVTLWITNQLFYFIDQSGYDHEYSEYSKEQLEAIEGYLLKELNQIFQAIDKSQASFWLVSNEVGLGIVPESALSRLFRSYQGLINQAIAEQADEVYFSIAGIPVQIK
ncbi:bifunctional adenosylcobinamide kinase/adenosylcobinamide-phosphate guanylyltransferase [Suicoccus acidiformans]|nr:bifunctional adenosylcobinamide kinase/adenosylcobinamide-phosphate guanylyltransferase [Suicoccus acidiformans]